MGVTQKYTQNMTAQTCPSSSAVCEKYFLLPKQAQKWQRGGGKVKFSGSERMRMSNLKERHLTVSERTHTWNQLFLKAHLQTVGDGGLI